MVQSFYLKSTSQHYRVGQKCGNDQRIILLQLKNYMWHCHHIYDELQALKHFIFWLTLYILPSSATREQQNCNVYCCTFLCITIIVNLFLKNTKAS